MKKTALVIISAFYIISIFCTSAFAADKEIVGKIQTVQANENQNLIVYEIPFYITTVDDNGKPVKALVRTEKLSSEDLRQAKVEVVKRLQMITERQLAIAEYKKSNPVKDVQPDPSPVVTEKPN